MGIQQSQEFVKELMTAIRNPNIPCGELKRENLGIEATTIHQNFLVDYVLR